MGSVGAPGGIQGTRTTRAPYASQPLFGRGNVPRPWPHPGQRVAPLLSSTQKKTLGGRPTRAFSCLEGQFALASRSVVEAQRIAGSPLWTDRPAHPQNQRESNANALRPLSQTHWRRSINAVFALVRFTGLLLATPSSKQWARQFMDAWPLVNRFFKKFFFCDRTSWSLRERVCGKFAMRRGASLSETLRTRLNGSTLQQQTGYTLNSLPSCSKKGGHLYSHLKANPHYEAIGWLQASRQPLPRLHILQHIGLLDTHIDRR